MVDLLRKILRTKINCELKVSLPKTSPTSDEVIYLNDSGTTLIIR